MDNNQRDTRKFLEEQLQWVIEQDNILKKIEINLYEMRSLAEYARDHELSSKEYNRLNYQINELKNKVVVLQQQRETAVH
ncbi:hypothetical protein [Aquibacillus sediminis]|uniref:hypothetical protein n=1 Tax=Aquibacillus sediminis TaxID=2574734 RepID=UPI001108A567|nr:hypothetical protein [Aquibacillus sediminis]